MSTKECFKCHKIKPLDEFYKHPDTADKHLNKCKECSKKDVQKRYYNPDSRKKIIEYEKLRFNNPERRRKMKLYTLRRKEKYPNKSKASMRVNNAIRSGRLIRLPCEICGNPKSQAHHDDYRKYLQVRWLCFKHHRELHNQIVN